MVKRITQRNTQSACTPCDKSFDSLDDLKDHILTTVHNGPCVKTRNFNYKMTDNTAKNNLIKGAKRQHLYLEYKLGATNLDFSDGSWLLVGFPGVQLYMKKIVK